MTRQLDRVVSSTVSRRDLETIPMVAGNEKRISAVILDGTVRRWVGIGWVDEGKPTPSQRRILPRVVD